MRRRRFLKAALGTAVGLCVPMPAHPRAEPPLSPIWKPGIWATPEGLGLEVFEIAKGVAIITDVDLKSKTVTYEVL